jgi:hypothetical protein
MRTLKIILLSAFILAVNINLFSQVKYTSESEEMHKSSFAAGFLYTEGGFGIHGTYYTPTGRITDLMIKLSFSGVSDDSEVEYYDMYGNSYIKDKVNRVFMMPLSIGIKHNIFYDDIEGNFKPFIRGGAAPTLIMTTPYNQSFFAAIPDMQTGFAIGPFAGAGIEYYESKTLGMSIALDYYYLPVIGREIYSLYNKPIDNVGGAQISFTMLFLK